MIFKTYQQSLTYVIAYILCLGVVLSVGVAHGNHTSLSKIDLGTNFQLSRHSCFYMVYTLTLCIIIDWF